MEFKSCDRGVRIIGGVSSEDDERERGEIEVTESGKEDRWEGAGRERHAEDSSGSAESRERGEVNFSTRGPEDGSRRGSRRRDVGEDDTSEEDVGEEDVGEEDVDEASEASDTDKRRSECNGHSGRSKTDIGAAEAASVLQSIPMSLILIL